MMIIILQLSQVAKTSVRRNATNILESRRVHNAYRNECTSRPVASSTRRLPPRGTGCSETADKVKVSLWPNQTAKMEESNRSVLFIRKTGQGQRNP